MVVGVEPLRHLQRRHVQPARAVLEPTRHREVARQRFPDLRVASGHGADEHGGVEHVIVEREIVARDLIDPGRLHRRPVELAELLRRRLQRVSGDLPGPEGFQGLLQLSPHAHARVAETRRFDSVEHRILLLFGRGLRTGPREPREGSCLPMRARAREPRRFGSLEPFGPTCRPRGLLERDTGDGSEPGRTRCSRQLGPTRLPRGSRSNRRRFSLRRRMRAGLRAREHGRLSPLFLRPPLPSPEEPVLVVDVVLAYRCGAAPEFPPGSLLSAEPKLRAPARAENCSSARFLSSAGQFHPSIRARRLTALPRDG